MATISTATNTASALLAAAPATAQAATQGPVVSADFAALLTGADAAADPAATPANAPASTDASSLQGLAGDGKDLPSSDDQDQADTGADQQDPTNAAALIWLALALPVVPAATPAPPTPSNDDAPSTSAASVAAVASAPTLTPTLVPNAPSQPGGLAQAAVPPSGQQLPSAAFGGPVVADGDKDSDSPAPAPVDQKSLPGTPAKPDQRDVPTAAQAPRDPIAVLANALRASLGATPPATQSSTTEAPAANAATAATPAATNAAPAASVADATSAANPSTAAAPLPVAKANPDAAPPTNPSSAVNVALVGAVQPASRAFAAALSVAQPVAKRPGRDSDSVASTQPFAGLADASATALVDAKSATVDTRHARWVEGIIDHIELLRDASNAGDTRIRLLPDALGKIDVAIRKDGDTVNVRFSADQAPTRQLLADAQPRLAEIAAGRGLRLGQTLIDGGDTGTAQQQQRGAQQQAANARQPIANAPSAKGDDSDDTIETAAIAGWLA